MFSKWMLEDDAEKDKPVKEFTSHYEKEMHHNIARMREKINQLRIKPDQKEIFEEIRAAGQAMSDLAMIYGYEGVEVIAQRIVQAVDSFHKGDDLERFLFRLVKAVDAIGDAMLLIDERRERELIRQISARQPKPEVVDDSVKQSTDEEEESDISFDIREDERLISLLSDADGVATEITHQEDDSTELQIDQSLLKASLEDLDDIQFDLPEQKNLDREKKEEDDVLEIEFTSPVKEPDVKGKSFWEKLIGLFGFASKNRITFQE